MTSPRHGTAGAPEGAPGGDLAASLAASPAATRPEDQGLGEGLLLAYYGDDFTGSTDTMEVMAFAGLRTVLFMRTPTAAELEPFRACRGIGFAGVARSCSPAWMADHLPAPFGLLFSLAAPITQYKVCSTFDSSPAIGSIGRAIELALPLAAEPWSPVVVGAPQLRRWQCFGNLFAGVDSTRYRLDRHPTMARHPTTPMLEADLGRHLAAQTDLPIELIDLVDLAGSGADEKLARTLARRRPQLSLFDVVNEAAQVEVGRRIWENRGRGLFSASSSGLQYALVAYWRSRGWLPAIAPESRATAAFARRMLVLSGSCSPATGQQIDHALAEGYADLEIRIEAALDPATREAECQRLAAAADRALEAGGVPLVYAARGPDDPRIGKLHRWCLAHGLAVETGQLALGEVLGRVGASLLARTALDRLVVAGGDTSGRVVQGLPILALEATAPLSRGSPICRVHADEAGLGHLELVLKGGQVGARDFFLAARRGHLSP